MHQQTNDRSCSTEAIGGNHFGPVMIYMAKVDDATAAAAEGLSWFKVDEQGYDGKTWGTDALNAACGKRTFTVPSKILAGDYLVRAEAIALHAAGQVGGAQFYMSCFVSLLHIPACRRCSRLILGWYPIVASHGGCDRRRPAARWRQDSRRI